MPTARRITAFFLLFTLFKKNIQKLVIQIHGAAFLVFRCAYFQAHHPFFQIDIGPFQTCNFSDTPT